MKVIGFTTQYYTLWDINVEQQYNTNHLGQVTHTWDIVKYCYLGNLSKTLEKAQEKAIKRGCIDIEPNHEVYGRNKSFQHVTKKKVVKEGLESCERSELLMVCCSNNKENTKEVRETVVDILLAKGYVENINGILTVSEHAESMKQWFQNRDEFLATKAPTHFFIDKNINSEGVVSTDLAQLNFNNGTLQQYYNGYNYYLPKGLDGKAKRIKNKSIELIDFNIQKDCDEMPYGVWNDSRAGFNFFNDKDLSPFFGNTIVNIKDFKVLK